MGVLVALQGLKDYWQYLLILVLLIAIVVLQYQKNYLSYKYTEAKITINQYQAESEAQEKRNSIAEKEVQVMKKAQDEELKHMQDNILNMDVNKPCKEAVALGIIAGRKIK